MKKMLNGALILMMCLLLTVQSVSASQLLIPVGQVIGLELPNQTVTIADFEPTLGAGAKKAGLQTGDTLLKINETAIHCAKDVEKALRQSDGAVELTVNRKGKIKTLRVSPEITQNGPKLGVYLKQGVTGVGTVTWYDPETGRFGTLGHGVNSPEGSLVSMEQGNAYEATVLTVKKGKSGTPGQLIGSLNGAKPIGTLYKNTTQGVFGKTTTGWQGEKLPVGSQEEVHTGKVTIRSTISQNTVQEYSAEILKIYPNSRSDGRNLLLKITDPALLETTGGIVQGMSGSPIIQDGKLVGAVTHVLVNDPTTGYGIFIENMLDAAA